MKYLATFFSHFGAVRFNEANEKEGLETSLIPVPRYLSSSCGTAVKYESEDPWPKKAYKEDVETINEIISPKNYVEIYRAENI